VFISAALLLVGLVCLSSSNITVSTTHVKNEPIFQQNYKWPEETTNYVWYSSYFNLSQGKEVFVRLIRPSVWGEPPYDPVEEYQLPDHWGPKYVYVDFIHNNTGSETQFEIWLYRPKTNPSLTVIGNITLYKNECLIINSSRPNEVGGIVKLSGSYRLRVFGPCPAPYIPPTEPQKGYVVTVIVYEKNIEEEQSKPYSSLQPVGLAFISLGLVFLAVSSKYGKRRLH
jgi:hypothetical protein